MINPQDMEELKRMATNLYDEDKKRINRIIMGIVSMSNQIRQLKAEVKTLTEGE